MKKKKIIPRFENSRSNKTVLFEFYFYYRFFVPVFLSFIYSFFFFLFECYQNRIFFCLDQIVFVQGAAATPVELCRGLTEYGVKADVRNVRLCHMHLEGAAPFSKKEYAS